MALLRCIKCQHVREVGNDYTGKVVKCPECNLPTPIYDTVTFVKALTLKYIDQNKELKKLQQSCVDNDALKNQSVESGTDDDIDIYHTKVLTQAEVYQPIVKWFEERNIKIRIDQDAIDTTGFFDEIALSLGNNFSVLKFVSDQIKYVQNKGYTNVKLVLANKSENEIKQIKAFCKELYDYSFVAKYFFQKKDNIIRLTLQTAPKIRSFFNGIWMEWFTLMKLLEYFRDNKINASSMRNLKISFSKDSSNELDIFFLTQKNIPVCIECKSGEFREDIEKYLKLKKQLKIGKTQFIICIFGLSQIQTEGMSSMYDLTFTNELNFIDHIQKIV